jgi:uncharacterized protein with von Willebrand factor type A (vWA) domain
MPLIEEMNLMANELKRKIEFKLKLALDEDDKVKVLVKNNEENTEYSWEADKCQDRYYLIKDLLEEF